MTVLSHQVSFLSVLSFLFLDFNLFFSFENIFDTDFWKRQIVMKHGWRMGGTTLRSVLHPILDQLIPFEDSLFSRTAIYYQY